MSEQLQPSNAAITAADLPETWIESVRSAIQADALCVRVAEGHRIEVYSERMGQWLPLSPVFVSAEERDNVQRQICLLK